MCDWKKLKSSSLYETQKKMFLKGETNDSYTKSTWDTEAVPQNFKSIFYITELVIFRMQELQEN